MWQNSALEELAHQDTNFSFHIISGGPLVTPAISGMWISYSHQTHEYIYGCKDSQIYTFFMCIGGWAKK